MPSSLPPVGSLGAREREIMNLVYRLGRASVSDVLARLDNPPSYSAVRTMLRYLESKGYLRHEKAGRSFEYLPTIPARAALKSALSDLLHTFFGGSRARAVAALLDVPDTRLEDADIHRLRELIEKARRK